MKLMKSGIELDAEKQEKIKGGHCVCYCDIGYMVGSAETYGVEGEYCACTCYTIAIAQTSEHMKKY